MLKIRKILFLILFLFVLALGSTYGEYWTYRCVDYWTKFEVTIPEDNGDIGHWYCFVEGNQCTPCIEVIAE